MHWQQVWEDLPACRGPTKLQPDQEDVPCGLDQDAFCLGQCIHQDSNGPGCVSPAWAHHVWTHRISREEEVISLLSQVDRHSTSVAFKACGGITHRF